MWHLYDWFKQILAGYDSVITFIDGYIKLSPKRVPYFTCLDEEAPWLTALAFSWPWIAAPVIGLFAVLFTTFWGCCNPNAAQCSRALFKSCCCWFAPLFWPAYWFWFSASAFIGLIGAFCGCTNWGTGFMTGFWGAVLGGGPTAWRHVGQSCCRSSHDLH